MSVRLAQIFDAFGSYYPLKASVYLKRVGNNLSNYFDLTDGTISIDASNYAQIAQASNKAIFDDVLSSYTGNGYIIVRATGGLTWPVVEYPILTETPRKYNLYLRMQSPSGNIQFSVLIDGEVVASVDLVGAASVWDWYSLDFAIPDTKKHVLGIRLEEDSLALDKVYLNKDYTVITGSGPNLTTSPFVTIHLQLYAVDVDGQTPVSVLDVYDFKTTIEEVVIDDWYNFSLQPIDLSITLNFDGSYALVMSSSGSSDNNFVVWELVDNNEYSILPSALMVKNV